MPMGIPALDPRGGVDGVISLSYRAGIVLTGRRLGARGRCKTALSPFPMASHARSPVEAPRSKSTSARRRRAPTRAKMPADRPAARGPGLPANAQGRGGATTSCMGGVGMGTAIHDDLFAPDVIADPYGYFNRLRAEDPVHWNAKYELWVFTRYDDIVWLV